MILKASEFRFPESVRLTYFPIVMRSSPPSGWPDGTVVMTEGKTPYRCFLKLVGASPKADLRAAVGDLRDGDPRVDLSIVEEIALSCPLKEEEAVVLRRDYEASSRAAGEKRPPLFVHGLIPQLFLAFESRLLSFDAALMLSLYASAEAQREILALGVKEASPEPLLRLLKDPFCAGDLLNRLERDPGRLKALGYESLSTFLRKQSSFSYGRARLLMRLAATIPPQNREGLTGDQGEFLLSLGRQKREALFRGGSISVDGDEVSLKGLKLMGRRKVRDLIKRARGEGCR